MNSIHVVFTFLNFGAKYPRTINIKLKKHSSRYLVGFSQRHFHEIFHWQECVREEYRHHEASVELEWIETTKAPPYWTPYCVISVLPWPAVKNVEASADKFAHEFWNACLYVEDIVVNNSIFLLHQNERCWFTSISGIWIVVLWDLMMQCLLLTLSSTIY